MLFFNYFIIIILSFVLLTGISFLENACKYKKINRYDFNHLINITIIKKTVQ